MPAADPIELLLEGRYPDPETGELLRADTRSVVIADSLDGREVELVDALGLGGRLALIADADTHAALGARVERALGSRFGVQSIVLPTRPRADVETLARLRAAVDPRTEAIVAVGAGTINDLSKLVARDRAIPQVVFATAPSMNGYTSLSASISEHGLKRSVRAATPIGVFFDLRVLAAAPRRLIRAGLGDSACRSTAQADWLLSHLLLDRPYREVPFALLAADEAALFADAHALAGGELTAMRHLVRTLVLSGFGMTLCGGSYPASQGEHLLAHYLGMTDHAPDTLHGEEIAVCTLAMVRLQERLLGHDAPPRLHPSKIRREDLVRRYGPETGEACWAELAPKLLDAARAEELTARLATGWDALRERLVRVMLGERRLREVLDAAGVAHVPAAIGWTPEALDDAVAHAREIRNRYTFLDFALDTRR